MKKNILYVLLLLSVLLLPLTVSADDIPLKTKFYSNKGNVGGNVVFDLFVCDSRICDGTINYDSSVLEFVSIEHDIPDNMDDVMGEAYTSFEWVKVISNKNGSLKFDFNALKDQYENYENSNNHVIVTFKVKSNPSNGVTSIEFKPDIQTFYGPYIKEIQIASNGDENVTCNCPNCPSDNNESNTNEDKECDCINKDNVTNNDEEKECNQDNLWFIIGIISLIINVLLLVLIIVLIIKKKNNSIDTKELEKKKEN